MKHSKKIAIFLMASSVVALGFSHHSKAKEVPYHLYLGADNVYYTCQGDVSVTPKTDDSTDNDSMAFDLKTVKIINDSFFTDKNGVYFVSTFNYYCYFNKLNTADSGTFKVLNNLYEKDNNNVYYNSFYHGGPSVTKIENADVQTFTILGGGYAKDKYNVYYLPNDGAMATIAKVTNVDPSTFEVFKEDTNYAMDKTNMYFLGNVLSKQNLSITNNTLYNNLKGKIILKSESNGEAYYINPNKKEMYSLSRPVIAFRVMRERGVGISNTSLEKILVGGNCPLYDQSCNIQGSINSNFAKSQKGKILLQVEASGEAWYVNPQDSKRYFLGRPTDAFNIMKTLGLGISNANFDRMIK